MKTDAVIDGPYRYWLLREWDPSLPHMCSFMLNPSTADAEVDDPTIRRNIHFAKEWGYGGLEVVNPYAFRTVSPTILHQAQFAGINVIGPKNGEYIDATFRRCELRMVAWGAAPWAQDDAKRILSMFPHLDFFCFGLTKDGAPRHPLYLKNDTVPQIYRAKSLAALNAGT